MKIKHTHVSIQRKSNKFKRKKIIEKTKIKSFFFDSKNLMKTKNRNKNQFECMTKTENYSKQIPKRDTKKSLIFIKN